MWDHIKRSEKPLVLYGTGNAAEKILKELDVRGLRASGIFASDGFVRDRYFKGFKVLSYDEARERFGVMLVLLCFGTHLPDVMARIERIASEQELLAPDLPIAGEGLFDRAYYEAHKKDLDEVRALLADEQSRLVFDNVIDYRLSGRTEPLFACHTPEDEIWKQFLGIENGPGGRSSCTKNGTEGPPLKFFDLGAYTGDTAELFIKACGGNCSRVICVEPDPRNFRKLSEYAAGKQSGPGAPAFELVNAAAGSFCGTVRFVKGSGRGAIRLASDSGSGEATSAGRVTEVRQITADALLKGDPVSHIKMDLEGAESEAVRGAEETIKAFRPRLMISAYHRREDLFAIPRQILSIRPDYELFLRKAPCVPGWDISFLFV
ncbi:MAG: FkbM family methyltransferase [Firmicutes bacterium]|nr:FkbM family methyltransferase [Bacillota bacterium]